MMNNISSDKIKFSWNKGKKKHFFFEIPFLSLKVCILISKKYCTCSEVDNMTINNTHLCTHVKQSWLHNIMR